MATVIKLGPLPRQQKNRLVIDMNVGLVFEEHSLLKTLHCLPDWFVYFQNSFQLRRIE